LPNLYLVWLEWPEKCFRVDVGALRCLEELVPRGSKVVRARSEASFLRLLPTATHALVWHFKKEWFAQASRLKVLATPGAGRELVTQDVPAGVTVHFGHFHGAIMAETVVGFILAWARGFFRPELKQPGWPRTALSDKCRTVAGSQAVIVGYGRIGKAIGAKLEALGVKVAGVSRHGVFKNGEVDSCPLVGKSTSFSSLLKSADWLVLALPSDTGTDDFLNAALLRKLPRTCVVVNVGRGNAVDEEALVEALVSGRLAGAYLDVFKGEPGPLQKIVKRGKTAGILGTDPKKLPWNLIRTPHSSAFAADYVKRAFLEMKDDGIL